MGRLDQLISAFHIHQLKEPCKPVLVIKEQHKLEAAMSKELNMGKVMVSPLSKCSTTLDYQRNMCNSRWANSESNS
jgi:hypothetical protein